MDQASRRSPGRPAAGPPIRHASGRGGFALFAAMFVLVVVGAVAVDAALRARPEHAHARNVVADVKARAAARAGVAHALVRLRDLQRRTAARPDRALALAARWMRIDRLTADLDRVSLAGGAHYSVRLRDGAARLSVNDATVDELRRLFTALGAASEDADIAAQSILDWRDPDDLHRPRGAEWEDYYRRLDRPVRPKNAPFASTRELRRIRGVSGELYGRAAPHLTAAGDGRVNLNTAPAPVLRALPGMTAEAVDIVLARRAASRPVRDLSELAAALSPPARAVFRRNFGALAARSIFEIRSIEVIAEGWVDGTPIRREVRARAVRSGRTVQLAWREER